MFGKLTSSMSGSLSRGSSSELMPPPESQSMKAAASSEMCAELERMRAEESSESTSTSSGYRFNSPEDVARIEQQRTSLWTWLKGVGSNVFKGEGVNITKISLPVVLFEPRSFLERLPDNWSYLHLLMKAADTQDPVERMRLVVTFGISGLCKQISPNKPFNPALGETYQASFDNGVSVFAEQISHHPPISSWWVEDPDGKFRFTGNGSWSASVRGNSIKGIQAGEQRVTFKDGSAITWELPHVVLTGILWGERVLSYTGVMVFEDKANAIRAEIAIDPENGKSGLMSFFSAKQAVPNQVSGAIVRGGKDVADRCLGSWLSHLDWGADEGTSRGSSARGSSARGSSGRAGGGGGSRYWDMRRSPVAAIIPDPDPLPSDSRFRADRNALAAGDIDKAQEAKVAIEEEQRRLRKLRKAGGGLSE